MKKYLALILTLTLLVSLLAGCAGTTVVIGECTCPPGGHTPPATNPPAEGALKTGLYIGTNLSDSKSAADGENGEVKYDVTVVAATFLTV